MMREKKQKQIEEMCNIAHKAVLTYCGSRYCPCDRCSFKDEPITCDECAISHDLYNAGYRKQEWISVDERLPEVGDTYIIVLKEKYEWEKEWRYHVDVASFTFEWDCIFHDWDEGQEIHITHWMPLPEAPKKKGGAE